MPFPPEKKTLLSHVDYLFIHLTFIQLLWTIPLFAEVKIMGSASKKPIT